MGPAPKPPYERFWRKVNLEGPEAIHSQTGTKIGRCWVWMARKCRDGYGNFGNEKAHRFAYESTIAPIRSGMQIDHVCRNRSCVNPAHLEEVTGLENTRRGEAPRLAGARMASKTHCPAGHPYSLENTRVSKIKTNRICRLCTRVRNLARYHATKTSHPLPPGISGLRGVYPTKNGKWEVKLGGHKNQKRIGTFATKEEAVRARDAFLAARRAA